MPITHSGQNITITGTETGNALRTYMIANSLGVVIDRDIIFTGDLIINAGNTLTDENALHVFRGSAKLLQNGGTTNYTNVCIRMTEGGKGFFGNCPGGAMNWTNSFYLIQTSGGRTDFFHASLRPNHTGVLNNVALVSDGVSFMHFFGVANSRLNFSGLTLDCDTGCAFEHVTLSNSVFPQNFTDVYCDQGQNIFINLDWRRNTWNFARDSGVGSGLFINPLKPAGWTGYTYVAKFGGITNPNANSEEYTHDVLLRDTSGAVLAGAVVELTNNTTGSVVYTETSGADGKIPTRNVQTHKYPNIYYNSFNFGIWAYGKNSVIGTRPFNSFPPVGQVGTYDGRISETVVMITNTQVTELNRSIVQAYPITVSLTGQTLTVTGNGTTLRSLTTQQLYDAIHNFEITNKLRFSPFSRTGATLDGIAGDLNLVLSYITLTGNITLRNTRTLTLTNGSTVAGTIIDSTANSAITFAGIDSWSIYETAANRDANVNVLSSGTGASNFRFNFVQGTTYYLRLTVGTDTLLKSVTPLAIGTTAVELTTAGLLNKLPTLSQIESSNVLAKRAGLEVINNGVKKASLLIPHTDDIA